MLVAPALHAVDYEWNGFQWIDFNDAENSVIAYLRKGEDPADTILCVGNFTPVPRHHYRIGVPTAGHYRELLNSDAALYGASNMGNSGGLWAEASPCHGLPTIH